MIDVHLRHNWRAPGTTLLLQASCSRSWSRCPAPATPRCSPWPRCSGSPSPRCPPSPPGSSPPSSARTSSTMLSVSSPVLFSFEDNDFPLRSLDIRERRICVPGPPSGRLLGWLSPWLLHAIHPSIRYSSYILATILNIRPSPVLWGSAFFICSGAWVVLRRRARSRHEYHQLWKSSPCKFHFMSAPSYYIHNIWGFDNVKLVTSIYPHCSTPFL